MAFDPFADEPTTDNTETTETKTEEKTNVAVSTEAEGKMTVTLKGGAGFDAPWIVIHAADAADALAQMQDAKLKELMDVVKRAGSHFSGGQGNAGRPAAQQSSKPPQQQAPSGDAPKCEHGEMVFRSGVSQKTGKTWKAHFCPQPKGAPQCEAQWIR